MRKFLILILLASLGLSAGEMKKLGQAGFKFMDVQLSARSAGMGGASTLVGDDANAIFQNPAGIAKLEKKIDFMFSKVSWIAESELNAVGFVANLGNFGCVGFSFFTPDYGKVIGTIVSTDSLGYKEIGELELGAYATGISYARRLTEKFMIGGNLRYAYNHLGASPFEGTEGDTVWKDNEASTLVYDIGTIFYPGFKSFGFGMSILNFSPAVKYEFKDLRTTGFWLPLKFNLGVVMDVLDFLGEHPDYSLLVEFDLIHARDHGRRFHLGGELSVTRIFKLRAGYKFGYDEESWSGGIGINTGNIKLDFAYSEFGQFNEDFVNRVTLGFSF
ncbi:MAG: PorV/PorQ family protein [candidate division WOR-3 bacterium]